MHGVGGCEVERNGWCWLQSWHTCVQGRTSHYLCTHRYADVDEFIFRVAFNGPWEVIANAVAILFYNLTIPTFIEVYVRLQKYCSNHCVCRWHQYMVWYAVQSGTLTICLVHLYDVFGAFVWLRIKQRGSGKEVDILFLDLPFSRHMNSCVSSIIHHKHNFNN